MKTVATYTCMCLQPEWYFLYIVILLWLYILLRPCTRSYIVLRVCVYFLRWVWDWSYLVSDNWMHGKAAYNNVCYIIHVHLCTWLCILLRPLEVIVLHLFSEMSLRLILCLHLVRDNWMLHTTYVTQYTNMFMHGQCEHMHHITHSSGCRYRYIYIQYVVAIIV